MLHDKATISQSLARGFDLCGWRGGGAAGGGAGKLCSRATGPSSTLAFGLAASRFLLRLLEPLRNPALAGRAEPAEGDGTCLSVRGTALVGGWGSSAVHLRQRNSLQPRRACVPAAAAGRLSGEREGDRTSISSLGVMDGDVCRRVVLFVVFIPETSRPLL